MVRMEVEMAAAEGTEEGVEVAATEGTEEGVEVAVAVEEAMEAVDTEVAEADMVVEAGGMVVAVVEAGVVTSVVRVVILQGIAHREAAVEAEVGMAEVEEVGMEEEEEAAAAGLVTTVVKRVISLVSAQTQTVKLLL